MNNTKSSKISSDKGKTSKTSSNNVKKSLSTEGLNTRNSVKSAAKGVKKKTPGKLERSQTLTVRDVAELALGEEYGSAFEKFWKTVTDGIDKYPHESVPRSTPVDNKITEIQKRIELNQAVLKRASDRMKGITFAAERENLSQWKEGLAFRNPSKEDLHRYKDVKALDLEMQKLREGKPDRNVFLRSSPGIVNFHETMESTLNMLDKIQKADDLEEYDVAYRNVKSELNLDFIKTPNLVAVSDEE